VIATYKPNGRWPANVLFSHLDGCCPLGPIKVHRNLRDATANVIAGEGRFGNMAGSKAIGTIQETLDTWACVVGCPVASLDEQSGSVTHSFGNAKGTLYETWIGASRYFKVIGLIG